jgi:hypothetical protein
MPYSLIEKCVPSFMRIFFIFSAVNTSQIFIIDDESKLWSCKGYMRKAENMTAYE